jgi:hypothetical protein
MKHPGHTYGGFVSAISERGMTPRVSQNIATAAALLDTLPAPSTNGISKVYQQLMNILDVAAM